MMEEATRDLLQAGSAGFGVELGAAELDLFSAYLSLLDKWSGKVNLTGVKGESERAVLLILDSLALAGRVKGLSSGAAPGADRPQVGAAELTRGAGRGLAVSPEGGSFRVLDLGSGAGVPGVMLKVALPDWGVVLCEPRLKRWLFLKEVARELGLDGVEVFRGRGDEVRGEFDLVVTKALEIGVLMETAARVLKDGGRAAHMSGPTARADEFPGFVSEPEFLYELPGHGRRKLLTYRMVPRETKGTF